MHCKETTLASDPGNNAARKENPDCLTSERRIGKLVEKRYELGGEDNGGASPRLAYREISSGQRIRRPVEEARCQTVMLGDRQQIPIRFKTVREMLNSTTFPFLEKVNFLAHIGTAPSLGDELPA